MTEFKVIERGLLTARHQRLGSLLNAIVETATTGKAIEVSEVKGTALRAWLYTNCNKLGLKGHVIQHGDHYVCWSTKKDET